MLSPQSYSVKTYTGPALLTLPACVLSLVINLELPISWPAVRGGGGGVGLLLSIVACRWFFFCRRPAGIRKFLKWNRLRSFQEWLCKVWVNTAEQPGLREFVGTLSGIILFVRALFRMSIRQKHRDSEPAFSIKLTTADPVFSDLSSFVVLQGQI